jgi:flavin-binding protein dodecin
MQVSATSGSQAAMQQIASAAETMKNIQQMALDKTQELNGKLIGMNAEQKVTEQKNAQIADFLA